jgi:acyl-coenzyme A thioesterase PaaI-like protein
VNQFDDSTPVINETDVDHYCFGCGEANPTGLRLRFRALPDGRVWTRFVPQRAHEGYLSMTHGGILTTLLDEAMSWAITQAGDVGVTTRMTLTFRQPARVGDALLVVARVEHRRGRVIDASARLLRESDDTLIAEAEGRFMRVSRRRPGGMPTLRPPRIRRSVARRAALPNDLPCRPCRIDPPDGTSV